MKILTEVVMSTERSQVCTHDLLLSNGDELNLILPIESLIVLFTFVSHQTFWH